MICVSISHINQISRAIVAGSSFMELRLDLIKKKPTAIFSLLDKDVKTIATCRTGVFSEEKRISLLKSCIDLGASYVDIEIETADSSLSVLLDHARAGDSEVIVSYHNFENTPDRESLVEIMDLCFTRGGDIAKIATKVNSMEDTLNLLSLYQHPGRKVILGMGATGRITRIMAPYLGAEFTFAAPGKKEATAPGQLTIRQLKEIYKVIDES